MPDRKDAMSPSTHDGQHHKRIGQILRNKGALTDRQLRQALAQQHATGGPAPPPRLGEICSDRGWCSSAQVADALRQQHEAIFADTTLGHILLTQNHVTLGQLQDALDLQVEVNAPLGQTLVAMGACTQEVVKAAIERQQQRRSSSLRNLNAASFGAYSITEILVNQELDLLIREEDACACDECRANALAIALNTLPPRYVTDRRLLALFVDRFRAESLDLIRQRTRLAVRRVHNRPKSSHHRRITPPELDPRQLLEHPLPTRVVERHAHLTAQDIEALFGPGHQLTPWSPTSQPRHFAARETIHVIGPKGSLERVRVMGPPARHTRLEVTGPDLFLLGRPTNPLETHPEPLAVTLWGPRGAVMKEDLVRRIAPHVHLSPAEAERLALSEGQTVAARVRGRAAATIQDVPLRIADDFLLELHLPADQAPSRCPLAELLLPQPAQTT